MKKRILSYVIIAVLFTFFLSSCALADDCRANCSHIYGFEKRSEATCKGSGAVYRECIKCGHWDIKETFPKVDHDFSNGVWVNYFGCLGYRQEAECSYCGIQQNDYDYYGYYTNIQYCYIHDYDFDNPVSVTHDETDPDCAVYEYKCKTAECNDELTTIKLHKWSDEANAWYEENKDGSAFTVKYYTCATCKKEYSVYVFGGFEDEYTVIKEPENEQDFAIVGFKRKGVNSGKAIKLNYSEYNRLLSGEKITFPMPEFMR